MDTLTTSELEALAAAQNELQWNAICDQVKAARGGQYPSDWYSRVVSSGLLGRTARGWKKS